jgi:DNA sulfur modification protein DndE
VTNNKWNRLRLSDELTYRLRNVKGRTGLTPNLICRIGFCLSLGDPRVPDPDRYDEDGPELNRTTLLGEWDEFYEALLRNRLVQDGLDSGEDFFPQLRAHMNRGAGMACDRLRDLDDVVALVPKGA